MLFLWLQCHQVDHIDNTYPEIGDMLAEEINGGKRFHCWYVAGTSHNHVWLAALIIARPFPYADSCSAVFYSRIHIEPLRLRLFSRYNDIDVVPAPKAGVR